MKSRNVFGGLLLIFLGAIFLLSNFGLIGKDIWRIYKDFWPLLLIALGLLLIFKNNLFVQIMAVVLIIAIPLAAYLYRDNRTGPRLRGPWVMEENTAVCAIGWDSGE